MCRSNLATTSYGFPTCSECKAWLRRLDDTLRREFGDEPPERYIDRARRAIRQRRAQEAALASDEGQVR